jgi:hypothetical protein
VRSTGFEPEAPTLVVCHDAGGAEIVARIARDALAIPIVRATGPAQNVFDAVLGRSWRGEQVKLPEDIGRVTQVVTGTGWQSTAERSAVVAARQASLPVASVLDHWVHYRERFGHGSAAVLPNQIWVGDQIAYEIACEVFDETPVRRFDNPCFVEFRRAVESARPERAATESNALFISDNVTEFAQAALGSVDGFGFSQFDALYLVLKCCRERFPDVSKLTIRAHPSEHHNDYESFLVDRNGLAVEMSTGSLVEDVASADIVFGLRSMALFLANEAGLRVVTAIPEEARGYECPPWGFETLASTSTS